MIPEEEIRALLPRAASVSSGLTHAEFNWHPAPGMWSIAEALAHLNLTDELYANNIEAAITAARQKALLGSGPFQLPWLERQFVKFLEPPYKLKFKAPSQFTPGPDHNREHVLETWRRTRLRLLALAEGCDGLHLGKVRVISPVSKLMTLSLLGTFCMAVAHDRRHLWQAEQIRSRMSGRSAASV